MSDVEKYGLVAVVFVGGLLLVIATQGGFGGGDAKSLAPEVIDSATPLRESAPRPGGDNAVRVVPVLPDAPFRWDEPPVPYPGRRSSSPAAAVPGATPPAVADAQTAAAATAAPAPGAGQAPRTPPGTHEVAKGETLETIAERYFGSKTRWKELLVLNPGLDPKRLQIGQVLRISAAPSVTDATARVPAITTPAPASAAPAPGAGAAKLAAAPNAGKVRTHTVVKGDTLGAIAKTYLGSSTRADEIYKANTDVLKNKDDLAVGQVLRIP